MELLKAPVRIINPLATEPGRHAASPVVWTDCGVGSEDAAYDTILTEPNCMFRFKSGDRRGCYGVKRGRVVALTWWAAVPDGLGWWDKESSVRTMMSVVTGKIPRRLNVEVMCALLRAAGVENTDAPHLDAVTAVETWARKPTSGNLFRAMRYRGAIGWSTGYPGGHVYQLIAAVGNPEHVFRMWEKPPRVKSGASIVRKVIPTDVLFGVMMKTAEPVKSLLPP